MATYYSSCPPSRQSRLPPIRRYQVRQKILSVGDHFKIKDEHDFNAFIVKSKLLSIGDHLVLEDIRGNELIRIRQEILHLHPTFHILSIDNNNTERSLAHLKQKLTFIHKKFTIDSIYGEYTLEAIDLLAHSFTLTKNDRRVAFIDKKFFSRTHNYNVEIDEYENQPFILALIIAINQILYTFHWQKLTILK